MPTADFIAWALASTVVAGLGGPLLGVVVGRWWRFPGAGVLAVVPLVVAVVNATDIFANRYPDSTDPWRRISLLVTPCVCGAQVTDDRVPIVPWVSGTGSAIGQLLYTGWRLAVGNLRLTRLIHARRGIPWLAIGTVAAPAVILIACAFVVREHPVAWSMLRSGVMVWAVTAAFLLDDPPAAVVQATPRSPSWWHESRFIGGVMLLVVPVTAASLWAVDRSDAHLLGITVQAVAAWLVVLGFSAAQDEDVSTRSSH